MTKPITTYKGVEFNLNILKYVKHMELVDIYREELVGLSKSWDNLSLLSFFVNNSTNINDTKESFSGLTNTLLNHLSNELLQKTLRQMAFKAQISIDILIRNLFERTADIGFLATDEDIRNFILNNPVRYEDSFKENAKVLRDRFLEYTQKYSVYYDIVLFDTEGKVLVKLDQLDGFDKSDDSIINQALQSNDYVESFKYHDFIPERNKSLVYASRVTKTNDENSEVIGVLCLCFRFKHEMKGIFDNLKNDANKECLTILDKDGTVLASSDPYHIALDSVVEYNIDKPYSFISHGGRDYLVKSCKTNGYQGYMGQEWYGHIMIPLELAFIPEEDNLNVDESILLAILQEGDGFSDELKQIPIEANNIQTNLNRLVWNGNVQKSSDDATDKERNFSRALLSEISFTGEKTKKIFDTSIANLTKTIILNNTSYVASLMVDIMDRNLYERANDCRWWALTDDFKTIMASNELNKKGNPKLTEILQYINDLYTVYTNLFIYDENGIIVAVSNQNEKDKIGLKLGDSVINKTKQISDSNDYVVSNFNRTKLYNDEHTYTYFAKITHEDKFVGGIGVVFDSSVEFKAMLEESIPGFNSNEDEKRFGVFVDRNGSVISSTDDSIEIGSTLDIDSKFFKLKNGESKAEIVIYNGKYYALGVKCSQGYREYKVNDNYTNDVFAVYFSYISSADLKINNTTEIFQGVSKSYVEDTKEVASFYIGGKWLGIGIENVLEVLSVDKLDFAPTLNSEHYFKGTLVYKGNAVGVIDLQEFLNEEVTEEYKEVVIVKHIDGSGVNYVGILINQLGDIPEVKENKIKELEGYLKGNCTLISSVVVPEDEMKDNRILNILDIGLLKSQLVEKNMTGVKN